MNIWHLTPDAPRLPHQVSPGEVSMIQIGTWPIEGGQRVWLSYRIDSPGGKSDEGRAEAAWRSNQDGNSYWQASLGPFSKGEQVMYTVHGSSPNGEVVGPSASFRVGPKLYLALLWHQHQPIYKDVSRPIQAGSYIHPWVRLHAIRDYYSMAALVAEHRGLHLTINLTPALLWQIEDYLEKGATDRALELSLKPAENLSAEEQGEIMSSFFDAHWHNQIFPHPRYKELFIRRQEGQRFTGQDLRDLQMWFNLAWFGQEFRESEVTLVTGEVASVHSFVKQGRDFSVTDIEKMVAEQYKIMQAVIPLHRQLQERNQIEISTTPFYHPILPLLVDTDRATIDRPGARHPSRFAHLEDVEAQVGLAVECYQHHFGRSPRGIWPAEGAVSQLVIPLLARAGVHWIATDQGVLARSGKWGYDTGNPNIQCQPYRAGEAEQAVSIFFRDTALSDSIGFHYYAYNDYEQAAHDCLKGVKSRFAWQVVGDEDRVLTVILDGENAWGAYREDARPFLHALYGLLETDPEVQTVSFSEYLKGNPARSLPAHPLRDQQKVYDLFTGSWIDENGSAPGVDLGTWIGEQEENRAWELLGQTRDFLSSSTATPEKDPVAYEALYISEGSDWFWWFGGDQDSGNDQEFDDLFRLHLKNVYRAVGVEPPAELSRNIVPHAVIWTFTRPVKRVQPGDRLTVRTNCPGVLTWQVGAARTQEADLLPAGGAMAAVQRYHLTLGPCSNTDQEVRFRFRCTHRNCDGREICCNGEEHVVQIKQPAPRRE